LRVPRGGDGARAVEMAARNAELALKTRRDQASVQLRVLEDVKRRLGLASVPHRIECIDVSHFQGSDPVASLVCFVDGEPEKSDYRRYRIRTTAGNDDFAAMREVMRRRFRADDGQRAPPDLLLVDGGAGQVSSVVDTLKELGVD